MTDTKSYNIIIKGREKGEVAANKVQEMIRPAEVNNTPSFTAFKTTTTKVFTTVVNGSAFSGAVSALAKVSPYVAIAIEVARIADKTVSAVLDYQTNYCGNFEYSLAYNNFKNSVASVFNPVGTAKRYLTNVLNERKQRTENSERLRLIGYANARNIYKGF